MEQNKQQNRIRLLRADEIECRIGTVSENGISLLLYMDARSGMKILDEVFGSMNWQRKHEVIGGSLYCTISVWDNEKKQWISKMDVGKECQSHTEKEKGQASDSFKRACINLGVGRELYSAPFIWVSSGKVRIEKKQDGKLYTQDKFTVSHISYNEENRVITGLAIVNRDGNKVYELKAGKAAVSDQPKTRETGKPADRVDENTAAIWKELERTGVALDVVLERYGVCSIQEMDDATYRKAMNSLKRTKAKAA